MTKKIVYAILLLCFLSSPLFAEERFPFRGKTTTDNVNVRAGQSVSFERLCKLKKGESVVVIDRSYGWYKISLPSIAKIYVHKDYVKAYSGSIATIAGNRINVRAGSDTKYSVVGQLSKGTDIKVKSENKGWYQIEPAAGMYGWVSDKFVTFDSFEIPSPEIVKRPTRNIYKMARKQRGDSAEQAQKSVIKPRSKKKDEGLSIVGRVEDLGRVVPPKDIRYKLIVDDETIYYLKGSKHLLDSFVHYKVRAYGEVKDSSYGSYEYPVIVVSRIKLVL